MIDSGQFQVVPDNENRALYSTHSFKILFKEGGCGTFVPLFFNLIASVRRSQQQSTAEPRVDPLQAAQTPVDEMMRHAYVTLLVPFTIKIVKDPFSQYASWCAEYLLCLSILQLC